MNSICHRVCAFRSTLNAAAPWVALLLLRVLVGWEFLEAGLEKLGGENWFGSIQDKFIFPFNRLPVELSWWLAMWFEIIGGIALILGVGTRFFAFSLLVLTIVATAAVHMPEQWSSFAELWRGYVITNKGYGNFKLPLIFMTMLWSLIFYGPGRLSIDALINRLISARR